MPDDELLRVLGELQRRGASGPTDLTAAIAHAEAFVRALPPVAHRVIDLGSGGGFPGVVIAVRRPDVEVLLVERRSKRADLLQFAVRALGLEQRVSVTEVDAHRLLAAGVAPAEVVTARSFGPPREVVAVARSIVVPGGLVLVSEPPTRPDRWREAVTEAPELVDYGVVDGVRVLGRR